MKVQPAHPAKFSDSVLVAIETLAAPRLPAGSRVLDSCAGVGKIHILGERCGWETTGVEIEPEWAAVHPRTVVGDATALPFPDGSFDAWISSVSYGNRMADRHDAQEKCKPCGATGRAPTGETCPKCEGVGRRSYRRNTYKHQLDRRDENGKVADLHPNNTGGMQWGPAYRDTHLAIYSEVSRVTKGPVILNISNHIRKGAEVDVTSWHRFALSVYGYTARVERRVNTPRNGHGANRDARVPYESVILFDR